MPHLTVEYTNNLSLHSDPTTLVRLNKLLVATGHFDEADIKTRTVRLDSFAIGTSERQRAFAHTKLAILSGRTEAVKSSLSQVLLEALPKLFSPHPGVEVQFCVEVLDIDRNSYAKSIDA
jgi:5-carboxymethyl-2-hydroxymuconate isomerase